MNDAPSQWIIYQPWRNAFGEVVADPPQLYTIEYLDGLILSGAARIWANDEAAIIAGLKVYPSGACTVNGTIAAGDLESIVNLIPHAEAWGKAMGAIGAEIESRIGWARALKSSGYEPMQLKLWKGL